MLSAEILRSPVEVGSLSTVIFSVLYNPGGCWGFLPSTLSLLKVLGGETSNIFYFHPDPWGFMILGVSTIIFFRVV